MFSPPSSSKSPEPDLDGKPNDADLPAPASEQNETPAPTPTPTKSKLRNIPLIPILPIQTKDEANEITEANGCDDGDKDSGQDESNLILASSLGLNHIRTRFAPSPSPLRPALSTEPGKKIQWRQSRSLRIPSVLKPGSEGHHVAFNTTKEVQSPRFQAIMRVTSGRKKRAPDIKSFSHELNSKGVRPFPFWKSRAFGHMEVITLPSSSDHAIEIVVVIKAKFDRLKEEVNSDLSIFAGDLVGILENNAEANHEWRKALEDLLVVAQQCAKMLPSEFWLKCEDIVQNLDDRRQELQMGILRQAHMRILFILTRCTRLVQFQKGAGYDDESNIGLHQLNNPGVYPEQILGGGHQGFNSLLSGKETNEKQTKKSHGQEQSNLNLKQDHGDQNISSCAEPLDCGTAKSVDSSTSRDRISSWKKLPSAAEKNQRKGLDVLDSPSKNKLGYLQLIGNTKTGADENTENVNTPEYPPEISDLPLNAQKVSWGLWGDQQNVAYENTMLCRICEVEIPTIHVEDHSRICSIADIHDLKKLTINERLERVADILEKILESCTKNSDTAGGSPEAARVSISSIPEEFDALSPKQNSLSRRCSEDMLNCVPEADNTSFMDDLKGSPMSSNTCTILTSGLGMANSSAGSSTPRSSILTLSGHEKFQQVSSRLIEFYTYSRVPSF
ncbi:hypothetical protein HHK36_027944 [Tetracentron sinense]|uniref:IREH1/IRE-like N-terminal domain-containing protein n=1 Tax=Tetracentron sinense TaxID=13715 RepID=A0A835D1P2_TETSI|nr:hypothetical protein HHK36_027944 [Tetracentron sinense]